MEARYETASHYSSYSTNSKPATDGWYGRAGAKPAFFVTVETEELTVERPCYSIVRSSYETCCSLPHRSGHQDPSPDLAGRG